MTFDFSIFCSSDVELGGVKEKKVKVKAVTIIGKYFRACF
jgi:hypothetical protein